MKLILIVAAALLLSSCYAEYASKMTGIRYRLEVPFSAVSPYIPIKPAVLHDK